MKEYIQAIIIAVLSSGAFFGAIFTFIQFCIGRHDRQFEKQILAKIDDIKDTVSKVEKGCTRTQLMVLMKMFNQRKEEIIKVAHKYFVELKGDFYMTTLFEDWLEENNINRPEWFKGDTI